MTSPTVSPSCFIKSFCQAGNPALLHYSYSAMETEESEVPTTSLMTCKEEGKTLCNICCHLYFSSSSDHQGEHRNHKWECTSVWWGHCGLGDENFEGKWVLMYARGYFVHINSCMCVLNLLFACVRKIKFCLMLLCPLWYCIYGICSLKTLIILIALGFPSTGNKKKAPFCSINILHGETPS